MTSAGGPPPGTSGYSGPGSSSTAPAHAAPSGGGNGLAAEVHTLERAIFEVKRIIVGQDQLVERMLVGLLSKGHVLLEGVPGGVVSGMDLTIRRGAGNAKAGR